MAITGFEWLPSGASLGGITTVVMWIGVGLLYAGALVVIVMFLKRMFQYNIIVNIIDLSGLRFKDRAREIKTKSGVTYLWLLKERTYFPSVDSKYYTLTKRGKRVLDLYRYAKGGYKIAKVKKHELTEQQKKAFIGLHLIPISPKKAIKQIQFDPQEVDMRNIHTQVSREVRERYAQGSFWDKYIVPSIPLITVALIVVLFVIVLDKYDDIQSSANTVATAMTNSVDAFNACKVS